MDGIACEYIIQINIDLFVCCCCFFDVAFEHITHTAAFSFQLKQFMRITGCFCGRIAAGFLFSYAAPVA